MITDEISHKEKLLQKEYARFKAMVDEAMTWQLQTFEKKCAELGKCVND